ncbi:MAG: SMP-30/gluconolactonase/LRE family protein, partial [Cyclobacteriaceae bacterium]|nr:SMP-30/gluconolactonase/LRE family protein [Cyclobacteriaceae bacterium]
MKKFLFILPSLFFLYGYGQPVTPAAELDYVIEEFTLPGGRQGNNVNAIVQGPHGFMWFGTHSGLHRYDGFEFVTYKTVPGDTIGETTSLTFPYVENLYWDKNNMLWVTTYGGGLYRFDPVTETFKHYVHDPNDSTSISDQSVTCAIEDANGELWFGTTNGLNRFDRETEKFTRYYANPQNPDSLQVGDIRSLYVDKQGTLWAGAGFVFFGDGTGALSRYNPETDSFTNYTYDPNDETSIWTSAVRGMLEDSRGNFWIGTNKGLQKMNRSEGTFERMPYDPTQPYAPGANDRQNPAVYSIHEDKKGGVWIGTIGEPSYQTHLMRFDPETKKAQVFPIQFSVWSICESTDGTLWTAGAGVSGKVLRIKPKTKRYNLFQGSFLQEAFRKTNLSSELNFNIVLGPFAMAIDPVSRNYWLQLLATNRYAGFTDGAVVLANYNPLSGEIAFHYLRDLKPSIDWSLPANQFGISGLLIDNKGTLWGSFPSANIGIFNYDPTTKKLKHYGHDPDDPESLTSNSIITLMMDSRGEIWAATFENGLNRLNPVTEKMTHYHFSGESFGEYDNPIALMEDSDGLIWVGGELISDGISFIAIIDPIEETLKKINLPGEGTFRVITTMSRSLVNGNVVFTVQDAGIGTYFPENGSFIFFEKDNRFPFDNAAGVVCDREGYFWVADTESSTFVRFSRDDDFVFEETDEYGAGWRSGMLGPNGHVYFLSTEGGWFEIDPSAIRPEVSTVPLTVQLIDLYMLGEKQKPKPNTVLDRPIWLMDEIVLPNSADNFGFRFSDFDFQNPTPQFEYRLYPYETTWKKSGYSPTANYYKVPSGTYTFQVKSFSQRGLKEEKIVELNVIILPPWWQTWWAYGIY